MRTLEQEKDLFFIDGSTYDLLTEELKTTVVCPKDEFRGHAIYKNFHVSNCHRTWRISDYDYVIAAQPGWYESLPASKQQLVFNEQKRTGSCMLIGSTLITQRFWSRLTAAQQQEVISLYDEPIEQLDVSGLPDRFTRLHGVFPDEHGGNCFAAALYGVTDEETILNEWMHDQMFTDMLTRNHYIQTDQPESDSVMVFVRDGVVVHACYMIDDDYCFNKSGQMFYNPWHIARIDKVKTDWKDCELVYYSSAGKANMARTNKQACYA
ncbi:hypothetical protein ERX35_010685 [Macrococcus equipercicus]|uniref:Uncharacterized protein n=1 Tax=Macrococcus equipercicus TaxID=69967 RepID=A0ABQ6R6F9_9STAP|nr:hypothetical protein [Macrococcus equipercicus]KAA1036608.1 hypothetical protein ERX35_010685 [Macrococcus equipercicus]